MIIIFNFIIYIKENIVKCFFKFFKILTFLPQYVKITDILYEGVADVGVYAPLVASQQH